MPKPTLKDIPPFAKGIPVYIGKFRTLADLQWPNFPPGWSVLTPDGCPEEPEEPEKKPIAAAVKAPIFGQKSSTRR